MKKVPNVGVSRKRGRPQKKQTDIGTSSVTGEGTQLSVTGKFDIISFTGHMYTLIGKFALLVL